MIGYEGLPSDIEGEIESYIKNGEINQKATKFLNAWLILDGDTRGTRSLLRTVRTLRQLGYEISLKGLFETCQNYILIMQDVITRGGSFDADNPKVLSSVQKDLVAVINRNALSLVREAVLKDQKIALYTGKFHCDIQPTEERKYISYVPDLEREGLLADDFMGIWLGVPEYVERDAGPMMNELIYSYAPISGILHFRYGSNGHLIYFPRSVPI